MHNLAIQVAALALSGALCFLVLFRRGRASSTLPPGPAGLPFLGNMLQIPRFKTWMYFDRLVSTYGPLVSLTLAGDNLLVLGDPQDAEELLGRRSHNYSSRKPLIFAGKYQSNNKRLVLLPYGDALKRQRAAFHQMLQPRVIGAYEAIQEIESAKLLHELLARPDALRLERHCRRYTAALVFHLSYGRRLADDDTDLTAIEEILDHFVKDSDVGAHLVDTFPVLDRLPDLLAPWRAKARARHVVEATFYQRLVDQVKHDMASGNAEMECFAARLWEQQEKFGLDAEELAYVAGSAFEAGTAATSGTMLWFVMAMVLHPATMHKAQAEIDAVVGADGSVMPGFAHIDDLPYCAALTKEVFRWAPATPIVFPHYSDHDDEYKGYKIPARTQVVPCIWTMHRNPLQYPTPDVFDPDRFVRGNSTASADTLAEGHYGFGFGRRKCPGQYLAARTIWLAVVRLLWAFNIGPARDAAGNALSVDPADCTSGISSRPNPFPVHMAVRSEGHAHTVEATWEINK
ncbi:cytochrome P450 [Phanerochaete sordida]|uniref:Cytochrome P450 n=1 Tax=Phanerochaete sordida TaxID=48140 RepID=A0A9P3G7I5_9APHY|nr:cytochrome P450 [Phanerochaete sordida]